MPERIERPTSQLSETDDGRRARGLSISFDQDEARWIDTLVELLRREHYPKATRSEVVRVALLELRLMLAAQTGDGVVRFFIQRHLNCLTAKLGGSQPHLHLDKVIAD